MRKKSASPAVEKRSELFYSGRDCRAYDYMGAHPFVQDGEQGYLFRVYAPEAANVSVMGEFNGWNREADYMTRDEQGIWEKFIPNIAEYTAYKYSVWAKSGDVFDKSDPYGFHFETRPGNATKAYDIGGSNGATTAGSSGERTTCRIPVRSTSTNAISARGRCTRTATFIPTARWRTSLCPTSRKWATRTSSSCR